MDKRAEYLNPQDQIGNALIELDRRYQSSLFAMAKVTQEMMTEETFAPSRAASLAATYLTYSVESWMHAATMLELRIDSREFETSSEDLARSELESLTFKRGLGANIIADAQRGNYRSLKAYLAKQGNRFLEAPEGSDSMRIWGRKLLQISRWIMDEGERFEPPMPAWQNPEFSSQISRPKLR